MKTKKDYPSITSKLRRARGVKVWECLGGLV